MGKIDLENSKWCDMVFEKRQKDYGAYDLRKRYSRNLKLSVILGILFFSLAVASPLIAKVLRSVGPEPKKIDNTVTVDLAPPPPVDEENTPPPPKVELPPPTVEQIKFTPPVIKKDDEVPDDEVPPPQEGITAQVSTKTQEGTREGPPPIEDPGIETGTGTGEKIVEHEPEKIYTFVEEQPEYPGGAGQLYSYISKNVVYPTMAKEAGVQGTVTLKFVVEKDGSIGEVQVMRGIGSGCDEEAARLVKAAGKWRAGKQNGKAVRVWFILPIKFTLQ